MEEQNELKLKIGNEEAVTLKPGKVKILNISAEEIGKGKKVICESKHPDNEEPIKISAIKYEKKGKLERSGTWLNLDSKGLIRKGSALAVLLSFLKCQTPEELKDKEIETVQDEAGYLVFKCY